MPVALNLFIVCHMRWICVLLLLVCCSRYSPERISKDTLDQFIEIFGTKYQLALVEQRVGRESLILRFEGSKRWKLEEARACITDGVSTLLNSIRQEGEEKHDRYLREFPIDDLDFTINLLTSDSIHISHAYLLDGTLYYSVWDPGQKKLKRVTQERFTPPE